MDGMDSMELDVVDRISCTRPFKYDLNQSSTAPFRPYDVSRRCSNVSWSTLSNAADGRVVSASPSCPNPELAVCHLGL